MRRQRYLGKGQIAVCQRSGEKCKASELVRDGRVPSLLVLPQWADPAHPQERPFVPTDAEGVPRFPVTGESNPAPTAPVLSAQATDDPLVTLTWTAADFPAGPPVDSYSVYRDQGDGFELIAELEVEYDMFGAVTGPALVYGDFDVLAEETYTYRVTAITTRGTSPSADVEVTIPA